MWSDAVIIAVASGSLAFLGILVNGLVVILVARLNIAATAAALAVGEVKIKAAEAAEIVKEVKTNLEETNSAVDKKLTDIHTLVNSQLGVALKLNAANSRWRALQSGKAEDIQAAEQAEELLHKHENNQADLDLKT